MTTEPAPPGTGGPAAPEAKQNPRMIDRFTGPGAQSRLIEAIGSNQIIGGDTVLTGKIVAKLSIAEVAKYKDLIVQRDSDNELFFILSGSVEILVNGRVVATRSAGDHVGEMALLDVTAVRSASVRATEDCVVGVIDQASFSAIAEEHPGLWRRMAIALSKRIMQRNQFHTAPREIPSVFLGSSSEGLHVAEAIQKKLAAHTCTPTLWSKGVFGLSRTTIEDLMKATTENDFAVIVLTPDDATVSRKRSQSSPRDNVVFELGLFMGALTRERTVIVSPRNVDVKIPTDLLGVTRLIYDFNTPLKYKDMRNVYKELPKLITKLGPR